MDAPLQTTTALLEGLFDTGNDAVWEEFHARYAPIILAVARRLGLNEQDAADVSQETLIKFLQEYRAGKYARDRGRLRSWIIGIAKSRVADLRRARARRREWRGESAIDALPGEDKLAEIWEEECRHEIFRRALSELREGTKLDERTIRAFECLCFDQQKPSDVAKKQNMPLESVYKAKQRCLEQLRTIIRRLNTSYELEEVE
ncbi:MAG: RNA polymerase sigma factor [Phycisphaerae bacterium]